MNELKKPSRPMVIELSSISLCLCGDLCAAFPLRVKKQHLVDISADDLTAFVLKITYSGLVVHLVRRFPQPQSFGVDFGVVHRVQSSTWLNSDQRTHSGSVFST